MSLEVFIAIAKLLEQSSDETVLIHKKEAYPVHNIIVNVVNALLHQERTVPVNILVIHRKKCSYKYEDEISFGVDKKQIKIQNPDVLGLRNGNRVACVPVGGYISGGAGYNVIIMDEVDDVERDRLNAFIAPFLFVSNTKLIVFTDNPSHWKSLENTTIIIELPAREKCMECGYDDGLCLCCPICTGGKTCSWHNSAWVERRHHHCCVYTEKKISILNSLNVLIKDLAEIVVFDYLFLYNTVTFNK